MLDKRFSASVIGEIEQDPEWAKKQIEEICSLALEARYLDPVQRVDARCRLTTEMLYLATIPESFECLWDIVNCVIRMYKIDREDFIVNGNLSGSLVVYLLGLSNNDPMGFIDGSAECSFENTFPKAVLQKDEDSFGVTLLMSEQAIKKLSLQSGEEMNVEFLREYRKLDIFEFDTLTLMYELRSRYPDETKMLRETSGWEKGLVYKNYILDEEILSFACEKTDSVLFDSRNTMFEYLLQRNVPLTKALAITERVRKGQGLGELKEEISNGWLPKWFFKDCERIKYLPPRGVAVQFTRINLMFAYMYKHHPEEFVTLWEWSRR